MSDSISTALDRAEAALDVGADLRGTGFWAAVRAVRSAPDLASRYGDRIATLDRRAFERGVGLRVPASVGIVVLGAVSAAGAAFVAAAAVLQGTVAALAFLAGLGALLVGTHSLAHWIVGRLVGIRFTHVFLGGPPPPRPGVKTDYASYLRASPRRRALMHASGAVVTKLVPFALVPVARTVGAAEWVVWLLVGAGVVQLVTDALLSTKTSDWMKVRRELAAARDAAHRGSD